MSSLLFSRRDVVAVLGSLASGTGIAAAWAEPPVYKRFRAVQVDVKPLAATGDTISARVISETIPPWIERYFGPYLAPGDRSAPLLIIRVKSLSFGLEGSANGPYGNGAMDYVEGEGVVTGAGGKTVATYPLGCSLFTNVDVYDTSGAYTRHRIESLGQALAEFLPGKMGL
jgi:hypothetical protein